MDNLFLPGVPAQRIMDMYNAAPGNEIAGGKFAHPESSAALAANAFGFFLERPGDLPLPADWKNPREPTLSVEPEQEARFPWSGGMHPWLDALICTPSLLIGVESKRFEPFRGKSRVNFSGAYWRSVWGGRMQGYQSVRDALRAQRMCFNHLDAAQLVKHALALRTEAVTRTLRPLLCYLYAEPDCRPVDRRPIGTAAKTAHREEIARFAEAVAGDEVRFLSCSWRALLECWSASGHPHVRAHADAVRRRFAP